MTGRPVPPQCPSVGLIAAAETWKNPEISVSFAATNAWQGEKEQAFAWLERA